MKKAREYRRLPGRRRSINGMSSLWQGGDHLLAVDRIYFEERYRRFHYSDIQALIIRPTFNWHIYSLVLGLVAVALLASSWATWQNREPEAALALLIPGAGFLIALITNLVFGRTCRCQMQMRVGVHALPSVRRCRQATRLLNRIHPLIRIAQKELKVSLEQGPTPARKDLNRSAAATDAIRFYSGRWHLALYSVLLVDLLFSFLTIFTSGMTLLVLNSVTGTILLFLTIAALVAQHNTALPTAARSATWGVLALYLVSMITGYFYFTFYFLMTQPALLANQSSMYQAMANLQIVDHPFLLVLLIVYLIVGVVCCGLGLHGTLQLRRLAFAEPAA